MTDQRVDGDDATQQVGAAGMVRWRRQMLTPVRGLGTKGYPKAEVDEILDNATAALEALEQRDWKTGELEREVAELRQRLAEAGNLDEVRLRVAQAMATNRRKIDGLNADAEARAHEVIGEARQRATGITDAAEQRAAAIVAEAEERARDITVAAAVAPVAVTDVPELPAEGAKVADYIDVARTLASLRAGVDARTVELVDRVKGEMAKMSDALTEMCAHLGVSLPGAEPASSTPAKAAARARRATTKRVTRQDEPEPEPEVKD